MKFKSSKKKKKEERNYLMMVQTPQPGTEPQRLEEPRAPSEQVKVVQWNLRSSFPSAAHLGFFFVLLLAFNLTISLQSSNRWMVLCVLCTFNIRSILHIGLSFFSQLDLNIISTMFLPESSGPSSDTTHHINSFTLDHILIIIGKS